MNRFICGICVFALTAAAQMTAPRVGVAADGAGRLRPIAGVAGNLIPGAPLATGVISAAASDTAVLAKTRSGILAIQNNRAIRTRAPEGSALFAFSSSGAPAFAWLTETRALLQWTGDGFMARPIETAAIPGEIVAVGAGDATHVNFAVRGNATLEVLRVGLSDGAISAVTSLPFEATALLIQADGSMVYSLPNELVLRGAGGHERQIAFRGAVSSIVPMSSRWVLIVTNARRYALRLADAAVAQVPEVK